jgi:hypothetical protein
MHNHGFAGLPPALIVLFLLVLLFLSLLLEHLVGS